MRKPTTYSNFVALLILLLVCTSAYSQLNGSTYASAKTSKKATFYYLHDGTPRFAEAKNGEFVGLTVDIMKEFEQFLQQEKGIQVSTEVVYQSNFEKFMGEVRTGKGGVFGLSNISISEARKNDYSFSSPYLQNVLVLLTHNDVAALSNIENIADEFKGMTACSLPNSSYMEMLKQIRKDHFPSMEIKEFPSEAEIIKQVTADKNSFAIMDVTYYLDILQNGQKVRRHSVGDKKNDQFGIIMPKGSDWQSVLNEFLDLKLIGSQKYSEMVSSNMGSRSLRLLEIKK